jgi:hypothetical protein
MYANYLKSFVEQGPRPRRRSARLLAVEHSRFKHKAFQYAAGRCQVALNKSLPLDLATYVMLADLNDPKRERDTEAVGLASGVRRRTNNRFDAKQRETFTLSSS